MTKSHSIIRISIVLGAGASVICTAIGCNPSRDQLSATDSQVTFASTTTTQVGETNDVPIQSTVTTLIASQTSQSSPPAAKSDGPSLLELQQWSERIEQQMLQITVRERVRRIDDILRELDSFERDTIDSLADQYHDRTAQSMTIIRRVRARWQAARDEASQLAQ